MKLGETYICKVSRVPHSCGHYMLHVTNLTGKVWRFPAGYHMIIQYGERRVDRLAQCVIRGQTPPPDHSKISSSAMHIFQVYEGRAT